MISRIYLIRHGITEGNQKMWFYGSADLPLAKEGKARLAHLASKGIYPEPEDADLYTSGLTRTEETFGIIFGDRPHKEIDELREMKFGDFECRSYDELHGNVCFDRWIEDTEGDVKPPGGESRQEFAERVSKGLHKLLGLHRLKELSHRHSGKDAVSIVVCHGGVISAIMGELFPQEKKNIWDWIPGPGFGYCIEFENGDPVMYEKINEIKKLGFGLMRPPMKGDEIDIEQMKDMVDVFMDNGYTYFDTAYVYMGGKSEEAAKAALVDRYPRSQFQLATKLPTYSVKKLDDAKRMFETSLKRTGAGFFDFYLLHNLDRDNNMIEDPLGVWDYLKKEKEDGRIVNLGFSFHDTADVLDKILEAHHSDTDFVQLQVNYADWEDEKVQSRKCCEVARKYGKPIIVMEPVRGGSLGNLPEKVAKIMKDAEPDVSLSSWAMRYAASVDGVMTVLSGMSTLDQVKDNVKTMENFKPVTEEEKGLIEEVKAELAKTPLIPCTACRYCTDGCPKKLNIPGFIHVLNEYKLYGYKEVAKTNYQWTIDGGIASDCIECGACEKSCPQKINIIEEMKKTAELFD